MNVRTVLSAWQPNGLDIWRHASASADIEKGKRAVDWKDLTYQSKTASFPLLQRVPDKLPAKTIDISVFFLLNTTIWAPPSEFVSSSIPSWHISTAHAQPFRGARDLAFCLKVLLDSLLVWASSEGSGETARMRRLAWTFAARIGD